MELSLAEQLLLLSYDEVSGKPAIWPGHLDYGLAGARLLDLTYAGDLTLNAAGNLVPTGRGSDPVLARFAGQKHSAGWWVYHLASAQYRQELLDRLVAAGMLERREHRFLGMFPAPAYPETDPEQERSLVARLRAAVTGDAAPDERSVSLIALAHACGLDRHVFPDLDKTVLRRRIGELTTSEWCAPAVRNVIGSMNAAVVSAISGLPVSSTASPVAAG